MLGGDRERHMMFGNDQVALGDIFTTGTGSSRKVYVVEALVNSPGIPLHVRLITEGQRRSTGILMSTSALLDNRFWQRVSAKSD
jgi:hypothetical protein